MTVCLVGPTVIAVSPAMHPPDAPALPAALVPAVPPARLSRVHSLRAVASSYIEIHPARLGASLLPRNVLNAAGKTVAACPADYLSEMR